MIFHRPGTDLRAFLATGEPLIDRGYVRRFAQGVRTFLIRGFDSYNDAVDFGRELIPRVREAVRQRDAAAQHRLGLQQAVGA